MSQTSQKLPTRKLLKGVVLARRGKTAVVSVSRTYKVPVYGKMVKSSKKYQVHDPREQVTVGQNVIISDCRPISKTKRFEIVYNEVSQ